MLTTSPPPTSFCIFNVEKKGGRKENAHPAVGLPWQQIRNLYSALETSVAAVAPPQSPPPPSLSALFIYPLLLLLLPLLLADLGLRLPSCPLGDQTHNMDSCPKNPLPLHARPWCRIVIKEDTVSKIRLPSPSPCTKALPPTFLISPLPIFYGRFIKQSLVPADSAGAQVTSCLFMRCQLLRGAFIKCDGGQARSEGHGPERAAPSAQL